MTKMLRPRYWCSALAVGLALSAFAPTAFAALPAVPILSIPSSGTMATPMGLADTMAGVLPPPGYYWLNYLAYVNKSKLADQHGNDVDVTVPGLGVQESDLKASAFVEAARFVWMTPYKIFGATWGTQVIFTMYNASIKLEGGPATLVDNHASYLGDMVINPIILAWHFSPNFHMGAGLDIVLPTGKWDQENAATMLGSSNVYTFEPLVAISYWKPGGIDLSAKIMYDFHTENKETNVKPGQEFHFDWAASWGFNLFGTAPDEFRAGLAGFCYWQTTDDTGTTQRDVKGDKMNTVRARQFGIGPVVKWWPKMGPLSVELKGLKEFASHSTAEGYTVWLDSIFAF